jgi:hypothetical protein
MISQELYPSMHALSKEVAEGRHDGINHLEFGLDLILDGLERTLKTQKSAPSSRSSGKRLAASRS